MASKLLYAFDACLDVYTEGAALVEAGFFAHSAADDDDRGKLQGFSYQAIHESL